jgi:hypothetical protein
MSTESTPFLQPGDTLDEGTAAAVELQARMLVILAAVDPAAYQRIEALAADDDGLVPLATLRLAEAYSGITTSDVEVQG